MKSANPCPESNSSTPHVLEWNSFSSLLPLLLLFIFHLGISTFPHSLIPMCGAYTLFFFCHLRGKPVGKRGAARGNVTFGSAANPQAPSTHELTHGFASAAVEHMVTSGKCGTCASTRVFGKSAGPDNGPRAYSSPLFRSTASPHVTKAIL